MMFMRFSWPHQTVSDIERGWILVNKDQQRQLKSLQEKGSKKEVKRLPLSSLNQQGVYPLKKRLFFCNQFIHLAQTLKYYGYIKFDPCITDFPEKGCQVIVSAGNNELNFHVKLPNEQMKEGSFKVTRMRCWRVTSSVSGKVCVQAEQRGGDVGARLLILQRWNNHYNQGKLLLAEKQLVLLSWRGSKHSLSSLRHQRNDTSLAKLEVFFGVFLPLNALTLLQLCAYAARHKDTHSVG